MIGLVLSQAESFVLMSEPANPKITLDPLPNRVNVFRITGVNVRWAPEIQKDSPEVEFGGAMSHFGGSSGWGVTAARPNFKMNDGYGNWVSFELLRAGVVRVTDNLGGFAEIDWNDAAPVVTDSRAMRKTASARGPSYNGRRLAAQGQLMVFVTPFLSWLLFTIAFATFARAERNKDVASSFWDARNLQLIGLGLYGLIMLVQWTRGHRGGEAGLGAMALICLLGIPALLTSAAGTIRMGRLVLQVVGDRGFIQKWSSRRERPAEDNIQIC